MLELVDLISFCFKQKTAYEMRISDWSSDVCSSDLAEDVERDRFRRHRVLGAAFDFAPAQHQRADAVRVAERHQAQAKHGRDHGVAATRAAVDALDRAE